MSSKIREKFISHMEWQGLSKKTQRSYANVIKGLAMYYGQSPTALTDDQVRGYLRYLITERKLKWVTCNTYKHVFTYFYCHMCNREVDDHYGMPPRPRGRKLPAILSVEEITRILTSINNLKHRVLLMTIYSAGLRVGEALRLKPEHIESDSSRMVIRIEQAKGRKDRYTILSEKLLLELRKYWKMYSPKKWLFPGHNQANPLSAVTAWRILSVAKKKPA